MRQLELWVTFKYSDKIVCRDCLKSIQLLSVTLEPSVILYRLVWLLCSRHSTCVLSYAIFNLEFCSPVVQSVSDPWGLAW